MRPLRWLLMATHVPDEGRGGGMVRYLVELVNALRHRDDVEVHVASNPEAADWWRDRLGDEAVHQIRSMPTTLAGARDLTGWGLPDGFDVLHGAKHLLPKRRVAPIQVLTVHDMLPLDRPRDFGIAKRILLRRPYLDSLRRADLLLCVSEATRQRLVSYLPEVASRTHIVRLAPSTSVLTADSQPLPGVVSGRFVLTVGDSSPRKNLATLLAGWRRLQHTDPHGQLVWVGPQGWGVDGDLEWAANVRRLGHVTDEQLRWCYENAAAVAVPSLLEGFGLPVAEARGFGAGLITSEDRALAEAADHGAAVADSTDPIEWAAAMAAALRPGNSASGSVPGRMRSWNDVADQTVAAVRSLTLSEVIAHD